MSEIEAFGQEKGVIYVIYQISESITKKSRQKFWAVKMGFDFLKIGHSKIWAAKFFSAPQSRPQVSANALLHLTHIYVLSHLNTQAHTHTHRPTLDRV